MALWSLLERIRSRAEADSGLRAYLSETFPAWPFTDAAVEISPTSPGVYLLYRDGRLIYIGLAVNGSGIRQELQSHRRGALHRALHRRYLRRTASATAAACRRATNRLFLALEVRAPVRRSSERETCASLTRRAEAWRRTMALART
jgi:hypothetical protein